MLLVDMMIAHSLVAKKPVVCLSGVRHLAIQTMESNQLPGGISKCEGAEKGGKFASHISRV